MFITCSLLLNCVAGFFVYTSSLIYFNKRCLFSFFNHYASCNEMTKEKKNAQINRKRISSYLCLNRSFESKKDMESLAIAIYLLIIKIVQKTLLYFNFLKYNVVQNIYPKIREYGIFPKIFRYFH